MLRVYGISFPLPLNPKQNLSIQLLAWLKHSIVLTNSSIFQEFWSVRYRFLFMGYHVHNSLTMKREIWSTLSPINASTWDCVLRYDCFR